MTLEVISTIGLKTVYCKPGLVHVIINNGTMDGIYNVTIR